MEGWRKPGGIKGYRCCMQTVLYKQKSSGWSCYCACVCKTKYREFPGSLVVKTPHSHYCGSRFNPWLEN